MEEKEKKIRTLVIVDAQFDFCSRYGSLSVKDGNNIGKTIMKIIPEFDHVVFTADWHPTNHCSFKNNGGRWPEHCVNYTPGAGISDGLLFTADESCDSVTIYKKGQNPNEEEYGAFKELVDDSYIPSLDGVEPKTLFDISDEIVVCGFAAGYCVNETLLNIKNGGYGDKLFILKDCTGYICTEEEFDKFLEENNIKEKKVYVEVQ